MQKLFLSLDIHSYLMKSGLLFSRSSTQTCDPGVKIPILLKKKEKKKNKKDIASKHIVSKLSSFLL